MGGFFIFFPYRQHGIGPSEETTTENDMGNFLLFFFLKKIIESFNNGLCIGFGTEQRKKKD
jgi:hypothetical protein